MGLNVKGVDAVNQFMSALSGISEPESKRKIIGKVLLNLTKAALIEVLNMAKEQFIPISLKALCKWPSATIKSHHNVRLPEFMKLKIVEPLKTLLKWARRVGSSMSMSQDLLKSILFWDRV